MTRHFATYFDLRYLPRGLALAESLRRSGADFHLHVLCLDDEVFLNLSKLGASDITTWSLSALEAADEGLFNVKSTRSPVEYLFTSGPAFLLHVLREQHDIDMVTYLDADMLFFEDPEVLFEEAAAASVTLVSHRYPARLEHLAEPHGTYNVAWLSFRRDEQGMACLERWRADCLEWCYDRVEAGRFADQKYLDGFPKRFRGVHVLHHLGADVAPWNCDTPPVRRITGQYYVGDARVVFFHFQGFRRLLPGIYSLGLEPYGTASSPALRALYTHYLRELEKCGGAALLSSRARSGSRWNRFTQVLRGLLRRQVAVRLGDRLL